MATAEVIDSVIRKVWSEVEVLKATVQGLQLERGKYETLMREVAGTKELSYEKVEAAAARLGIGMPVAGVCIHGRAAGQAYGVGRAGR